MYPKYLGFVGSIDSSLKRQVFSATGAPSFERGSDAAGAGLVSQPQGRHRKEGEFLGFRVSMSGCFKIHYLRG